ncbi:3-oxoacyl-ACP reductase [uncultured Pseudokineococcus sp.]|uniref:3-oxoacyl-ACP reductase n=1 Tax=uncultured Pseudokineococcus sp. TaxID=1642928 RepID=UPI00261B0447|nr:3-oxoacyl-ACP reductase [uncultured Pseudokineococcus sp.]
MPETTPTSSSPGAPPTGPTRAPSTGPSAGPAAAPATGPLADPGGPVDRYAAFARSGLGRRLVPGLGLPDPVPLRRDAPGAPLAPGPVLVTGLVPPDGAPLVGDAAGVAAAELAAAGARVVGPDGAGGDATAGAAGAVAGDERWGGLVVDATAAASPADLVGLVGACTPHLRRLARGAHVVVLGLDPDRLPAGSPAAVRVAQRALEGFTRSLGKEVGGGRTVQLVLLAEGGVGAMGSTLRFLLSGRSAFVSGQVVRVGAPVHDLPSGEDARGPRPLAGRRAVVTGAARGIGAAVAQLLGARGAHVVCVDVPAAAGDLAATARAVGGEPLVLDITSDLAPGRLAEACERLGGVDVVVHNAGITRDRRLRNMRPDAFAAVLDVNVGAPLRLTEHLLGAGLLGRGGRVVGVSSLAGIAGNDGQTSYAASKAGVIGLVDALAPRAAAAGTTVNAVAPGFIETRMTATVPPLTRQLGRRLASLGQGGLPVDVAEAIAWFAEPATAGVHGQVLRVCGQSLLGA